MARGSNRLRAAGLAGLLLALLAPAWTVAAEEAAGKDAAGEFRVCADPNNLPFSNDKGEGFENKLAELVAKELGKRVTYTWWAQRRGFVRNTLKAGRCDVIMGVPAQLDMVATTRPYYRSSYVFLSRDDRRIDLVSISDPRLRDLRIGVHLLGDDGFNTPPANALGEEGITRNVVGYSIYGDYRTPNPPARLVRGGRRWRGGCGRGLGTSGRLFRPAFGGPSAPGADHGDRGLCAAAVPVRYRDGRAQAGQGAEGSARRDPCARCRRHTRPAGELWRSPGDGGRGRVRHSLMAGSVRRR